MATKKEIKAELDGLGIDYDSAATKAELEALLPVPDVTEASDTGSSAQSFEDVTGLCRQCGKPADHLHQGV